MYNVLIDELVFEEDFKDIDRADQQKIIRLIRKKLTLEPERYGKPLKGISEDYVNSGLANIGLYTTLKKIRSWSM